MNISTHMWKQESHCFHFKPITRSNNPLLIQLMRISLILLLLIFTSLQLLLAIPTRGQDMKQERVNLSLSGENLLNALVKIEKQTPFRFYYRKAEIKAINNLSLPAGSRTVEQTLAFLLENTFLSFRQLNGYILLEKKSISSGFEISGRVIDQAYKGIASATVSMQKVNENLNPLRVKTDSAGYFKLLAAEKGSYILQIAAPGKDSLSISISLLNTPVVELPEIMLSNQATQLAQVNIIRKKPLIERKIDRMVFNVESSIAAKGTDVIQALALTPMLRVDHNSISIIGKSGVAVMINERMVNIGGADLINYLRSLRSDDIEKIEVITTPPARYEAQGNSGLINIVLKSNPNLGWSGSLSAGAVKTSYGGYSENLNLNYQTRRLSSSFKLRQYYNASRPTEQIRILGASSILNTDVRKDMVYGFGGNLSLDYKITEKASLGFIYDLGKLNYNMDIAGVAFYKTGNKTDSLLQTTTEQRNPALTQTINVYHDQKLGKSDKKLSSGFNFFSTLPKNEVGFITQSDQHAEPYRVRNSTHLDFRIWSVQSDLTLPYSWAFIETGLKFTGFNNNSEVSYLNFIHSDYQADPSKSNQFDYKEQNMAAYLSAQKDFGKKWSAKAGLRYEYTLLEGYSPGNQTRSNSEYGKFFPSLYLSYKPGSGNTLGFSYSKRINRPNFRALNPFRWYSNPYMYSTGNPLLQPSFNHNAELSYLYKGMLSFTLYGQKTVNGYGRLTFVNSDLLKVVDYRNYLTQYQSGFEASISHKFFPWWENREFISLNFTRSISSEPAVLLMDGSAFYYSTYNTFTLNKSISLFVNFWQSPPSKQGNQHDRGRSYLSSGFRLSMLNNRLQFNVSGEDLFKGSVSKGEIYYQQYTQTYRNYYDNRRLNLNMSYTFGKDKVKGNKKQISFKETQRAN